MLHNETVNGSMCLWSELHNTVVLPLLPLLCPLYSGEWELYLMNVSMVKVKFTTNKRLFSDTSIGLPTYLNGEQ